MKNIPANTEWVRLKQQQPGDYTNRGGIISRDGARSNVSNAGQNAKVEQAKAVIRQLESKPSLTPQEQADLEELKRFVGEPVQQFGQTRQRTPVRGNLPELQTETVMGNTTLPGSTGNR